MKVTGIRLGTAALAVALLGAGSIAVQPEETTSNGEQKEVGVAQTAEEHFARAASYREKAAAYREEAKLHREMLAEYKRKYGDPVRETKTGRELPWIAKMRLHCEHYIKQAKRLADEAERFAEFHRMRGEEMQGK